MLEVIDRRIKGVPFSQRNGFALCDQILVPGYAAHGVVTLKAVEGCGAVEDALLHLVRSISSALFAFVENSHRYTLKD